MTIEVRNERVQDAAAIQQVHIAAFGGSAEAKLVRLISERKKALISLVAVSDDSAVGHILFSRVTIDNAPPTFNGVGLAPLAVSPEFQQQGIGSKLIWEGLERCKQDGYDAVVVLGGPAYYSALDSSARRTLASRMNTPLMMSLWCWLCVMAR